MSQAVASHSVTHRTEVKNGPVHCKPRRLDAAILAIAKSKFESMLADGTIRPSSSNWASPLHMVPKSNDQWPPCGDYRAVNAVTATKFHILKTSHSFLLTRELSAKLIYKKLFIKSKCIRMTFAKLL